jgi:beta-N-acetylhexosaminidase
MASVDQEGGRVARLRGAPFTALPPMRALGASGDLSLVERAGLLLAHEVRAMGFDIDFAPVVDVDTNPANPVIGDRSFHRDAHQVAKLGVALSRGLEAGGVASCAKHFPGHGDTAKDSHTDLPKLPHDLKRLRDVELVPFAAYAKAGLAFRTWPWLDVRIGVDVTVHALSLGAGRTATDAFYGVTLGFVFKGVP